MSWGDHIAQFNTSELSERFRVHLVENGIDGETAEKVRRALVEFIDREVPEINAIPAIRELRWQSQRKKIEASPPYPGLRNGADPIDYLMSHYGEAIRSGELGPGRLDRLDPLLHASVRSTLKAMEPSRSMAEFFTEQAGGRAPATMLQRRLEACTEILDSTPIDAAKFFSSVRAGRWQERQVAEEATSSSFAAKTR